ncbi:unnamed protein product [Prorocentrum cordatum]|uniref:Uncharacterized protein n=1 Tax=Prorocentrum cordatum TaxID=2364126 RepID=A0ABN9TEW8_9DINO|nr:unnamed protein product [Polarella glacialis]
MEIHGRAVGLPQDVRNWQPAGNAHRQRTTKMEHKKLTASTQWSVERGRKDKGKATEGGEERGRRRGGKPQRQQLAQPRSIAELVNLLRRPLPRELSWLPAWLSTCPSWLSPQRSRRSPRRPSCHTSS